MVQGAYLDVTPWWTLLARTLCRARQSARVSSPETKPRNLRSTLLLELLSAATMQHTDLVAKSHQELRDWPGGVVLEVVDGPDTGRRFELFLNTPGRTTDRFVGGRGAGCDIRLTDPSVSEYHFSLLFSGGMVRLGDESSRNGTWVGLARLDATASAQLLQGAEFRACNTTMRLTAIKTQQVAVSPGGAFGGLRGVSEAMLELFAKLEIVAPTPLTVLISGETGVGKGEVAKAIHGGSVRSAATFHRLDCGIISQDLAGGALFGHAKGAFTGADADKPGIFEVAQGSTLFLDEIGELSPMLQKGLLTALSEKTVTRLGEATARPINVRIVAATNRDLRADVERGLFRSDLYHRLREFELTVPPLRQRPEDVVVLAEHFVAQISKEADRMWYLRQDAKAELKRLPWPGNARELKNVMKRATYLTKQLVIGKQDLHLFDDQQPPQDEKRACPSGLAHDVPDTSVALRDQIAAFEIQYCKQVMLETDNKVGAAAAKAGYAPQGFRDLLKRLDLQHLLGP